MVARKSVLKDIQSEEVQLAGLLEGLQQAERGELSEGSGTDAVRRAFARARTTS